MFKKSIILCGILVSFIVLNAEEKTRSVNSQVIVSSEDKRLNGQLFHPKLNPNDVNTMLFVKQEKDDRQLWFLNLNTNKMEQINPAAKSESVEDYEEESELIFQSYTDQAQWCPVLHDGVQYLAYVSAGSGNNMDIYVHAIGSGIHTRLTSDPEVDEFPVWSPDGRTLIFVSARSGNGDIYRIQDITPFLGKKQTSEKSGSIERLTDNPDEDMLPAYSPNGRYLAYTMRTQGKRKRGPYTIALMDFKNKAQIKLFNNRIVNSKSHPSWSFDGHFVAYQISNDLKDRAVDVGVMQLKIDPMGRLIELTDLVGNTPKIAENVYPNTYSGPTWLPGSRALVYAKRESSRLNPLEVVNLEQWLYNQNYERTTIDTKSSIHRDVDCLPNHPIIVFAGQTGLNFNIFGSLLAGPDIKVKTQDKINYALFK